MVGKAGCYSNSPEETAAAAFMACGDVTKEDLLVWCFKQGKNEVFVSELYSQALSHPKYALLIANESEQPMGHKEEKEFEVR